MRKFTHKRSDCMTYTLLCFEAEGVLALRAQVSCIPGGKFLGEVFSNQRHAPAFLLHLAQVNARWPGLAITSPEAEPPSFEFWQTLNVPLKVQYSFLPRCKQVSHALLVQPTTLVAYKCFVCTRLCCVPPQGRTQQGSNLWVMIKAEGSKFLTGMA